MARKNRNSKKRLLEQKKNQKVSRTKIEAKVAQYLDCLKIKYKQNSSVGKYNVDFLVDDKYIIECYGNFWHCNPRKYAYDFYNRGLKCHAHEKWDKDENRQRELEEMGYKFLTLWESEINKAPKSCKGKVKRLLDGN